MNKKEVCVWKNSDFWIKKRRVKKISERKKEKSEVWRKKEKILEKDIDWKEKRNKKK